MRAWIILAVCVIAGAIAVGFLGSLVSDEYAQVTRGILVGLLVAGSAFAAGAIRKRQKRQR
jgi:hypothetical protein